MRAIFLTLLAAGCLVGIAQATPAVHHSKHALRGPRGLRGPQGPSGILGTQVVQGFPADQCGTEDPACSGAVATVTCPAGTVVVGGGFRMVQVSDEIIASEPASNGWRVSARNHYDGPNAVIATAICATVP